MGEALWFPFRSTCMSGSTWSLAAPSSSRATSTTSNVANFKAEIPLLIRLGVEIKANENVEPWFFFDLGPGIHFGSGNSGASFAWRIGAGTAFWGVMGKNKNKSDSAATASSEPAAEEPIE